MSSTGLADIADALGVSMRDLVRTRRPSPVLQFAHRLGTAGEGEAGDEALAGVCTSHPRFRAVLVNTDQWGTRQRFTAAHELGHLLFGDAGAGWHDDHDADMRSGSTSTQEIRPNAFAAELLLPLEAVDARVAPSGVTEAMVTDTMFDYGVSLPSMVYRLVEGGHISRDEADNWRSLSVNNLAWTFNRQEQHRRHDAARGRVRAPSITHQRSVRAYAIGAIGIGPLAGLLGADAEQRAPNWTRPGSHQPRTTKSTSSTCCEQRGSTSSVNDLGEDAIQRMVRIQAALAQPGDSNRKEPVGSTSMRWCAPCWETTVSTIPRSMTSWSLFGSSGSLRRPGRQRSRSSPKS